jgi:hypothetical protein
MVMYLSAWDMVAYMALRSWTKVSGGSGGSTNSRSGGTARKAMADWYSSSPSTAVPAFAITNSR